MPLIDGEKFACSSCIKGHRVSGCNHTDRELHHINPKGRPVKQCEHCRGARKSKSHHAKCDCGDKKDKDKHKDKGDAKVNEGRCNCHSGAKCICGVKKDILDLRLDTGKQTLHGARQKPKLNSAHSESTLTVFANGHHQPCHRKNNTAHVSGAPYKIPRPHTLHGPAAFAAYSQANGYGQADCSMQRSMDTLSVSNNDFYNIFGSAQRSVDSLPITPLTGSLDASGIQDSLFSYKSSSFGQDGNSPSESHLSDTVTASQWPWASNITPVNRNFNYGSLSTSPSQDCLPNLENEWPVPSAGLNPLWSAGDLPLDPSKLTSTMEQPISHSGESKQSAPGLTTGSSSQSEIGEPTLFGDLEFRPPQSTTSESLFWEDRIATSMPSESLAAPTSIPTASPSDRQGLDLDFAKSLSTMPAAMTTSGPTDATAAYSAADYGETRAIAIPNNMDDVVSNDPWLLDQNSPFAGLSTFDSAFPNWL